MRRIMVMNLGSTSFKFKLYEMGDEEKCLASGGVESIGSTGTMSVTVNGEKMKQTCACMDHSSALDLCLAVLRLKGLDVEMASLDAVGYKAVHGGRVSGARFVDEELMAEMERMCILAPAHNPVYLNMMRAMAAKYPSLTQIACFETAFHATIPLERAVYGVPYEWVERYGIRRYGFHGSSHSYIAWKMAQAAPEARRVISVHLGGSCSLCAIKNGKSVANSMGATPQSGVFHNNRVGDLDVFCLPALADELGGYDQALRALSKEGGLLGLSGVSNDMRLIEEAADGGNERAQLALDAFVDCVVGYIGMYTAFLGGVDAICFTGGIGTNDARFRKQAAEKLSFLNAEIDDSLNVSGYEGMISTKDSGVSLWVFETNEELMVARGCVGVLGS